jgi:hypothetical protein
MQVRNNGYKNTQRWRSKARIWINRVCGNKCQSCGYDKYFGNLVFHHLNDKKELVSRLINKCASWDTILKESNKCVFLCHNCHGEIHAGLRECPSINHEERTKNTHLLILEKPVPKYLKMRPCVECGNQVPSTRKYCNQICAHKAMEKIKWPDNLVELVLLSSSRSVGRRLGVSDKAVKKHLDKLNRS